MPGSHLNEIINRNESQLLSDWLAYQQNSQAKSRFPQEQMRESARSLLDALREWSLRSPSLDWSSLETGRVKENLGSISKLGVHHGLTPSETAAFVFSLKQPVFDRIRRAYSTDPNTLADALWQATALLDQMGLYTAEVYQKSREELIVRQQHEMLELSTPVVRLWNGVLALPLIGTLDSSRTQVVMENLLEAIVSTEAEIAIIDITGVPTVDTLVAQHLLKTVAAARLMGADCIISGIRPQIAQTIIHLGVELNEVVTKATLADAFQLALKRLGMVVARTGKVQ